MKKVFLLLLWLTAGSRSYAQLTENAGWLYVTHQQKLSSKFDLLADAQLRSANRFNYLNTLLLRTGISYNITRKHSIALGYAYKGDWEHQDEGITYSLENRIFEQYLYEFKLKHIELMLRARLEQRWVKEEQVGFSQRTRGFISAQIPLLTNTAFTKGMYAGLQNEIFFNVQNKQRVNNRFLDQNRSMLSVGYRWSKKIDTEIGYLFWYQPEMENTYRRNVFQLMITTQF